MRDVTFSYDEKCRAEFVSLMARVEHLFVSIDIRCPYGLPFVARFHQATFAPLGERAMELFLTNRTLKAAEALEWGLINRVVPQADLAVEVDKLAEQLANGPTQAYGGVKKLLLMSQNDSLESQMERESQQIAALSRSTDGLEGVCAFVEKRKANFVG